MTTVRLPMEMEQKLEILARKKHKSKTDLIREALENLFKLKNESPRRRPKRLEPLKHAIKAPIHQLINRF